MKTWGNETMKIMEDYNSEQVLISAEYTGKYLREKEETQRNSKPGNQEKQEKKLSRLKDKSKSLSGQVEGMTNKTETTRRSPSL